MGLITTIFWTFIITVALWILCAFSGRLVQSGFRMKALLHLLCLAIAIPTFVLLIVFFMCNKVNRTITQVETGITRLLITDGKFVDGLRLQISQTSSTKDVDKLLVYLAENFSDKLSSEYPVPEKYLDINQIRLNADIEKRLSGILQEIDGNNTEVLQCIVQTAVSSFTGSIRSKVKSTGRKTMIAVIVLQAIAFGTVFYRAGKYRSPVRSNYFYESNDY